MKFPRLGVESELQLPTYTTAIAMPDLSFIWDLHHSSQQCRILNPLCKARDQTCVLMLTSQIPFCWATMGTPCRQPDKKKKVPFRSYLVAQWVKDLVLSLVWLGLDSSPWELPHATGGKKCPLKEISTPFYIHSEYALHFSLLILEQAVQNRTKPLSLPWHKHILIAQLLKVQKWKCALTDPNPYPL